ncbi:MAG: ABC transporter permease [Acidobacteriota bacterium]
MGTGIGVVFRKEMVDNLRDRRSVSAALLYPLLGPVLIVVLLTVVGRQRTEQAEKPLELPVVGAEYAAPLIDFLGQNGVEIQEPPGDPEEAVKAADVDLVLEITEDWGAVFALGQPATVRLIVDESRQTAEVSVRRARRLLRQFNATYGNLRLMARGIDPTITDPLAVETVSVATDQSRAAMLLGMAPYFIILSIFIGGMYLAIDTTAGERERGSLEPLLINPVPRSSLVMGKYIAVLVFTTVALVETLVAFALVLNLAPLETYLGIRVSVSMGALFGIFLLSVPIMFLAAALQVVIATFTRSFKEAQNYLSILPLVPALPGLFLTFVPVKVQLWHMLIPTFGQQLLINRLFRGEDVDLMQALVSAVGTLAVSAALFWLAVRLFQRESTLSSG